MEFVKCYQDLCREIEIYEMRLESLIAQKDAIVDGWLKPISDISGIDYAAPRVQENHCKLDFEEHLEHVATLDSDIEKYKVLLIKLKESRDIITVKINKLDGIEHKVVKMREYEGKKLKSIANELNYSYGYIRSIYSAYQKRRE
jgi:DNA-directed RNA polymerase specialized sigma24 family protein